ncbi:MAG TPA: PAS domain S-box protein, partial [bacterium]
MLRCAMAVGGCFSARAGAASAVDVDRRRRSRGSGRQSGGTSLGTTMLMGRIARGAPRRRRIRVLGPGLALPAAVPATMPSRFATLSRLRGSRWWVWLGGWSRALRPAGAPAAVQGPARGNPAEQRHRMLVERATDAMIVVNPADVILEVNSKACELFGYTRDELVGMDYPRLVDPEDLKRLPPQVGAAFAGASILLERRYVRKDGTRFDGELSNALVNAQSELCIIRDITERKRIEAALACREREYRLLLQEAYDAILVIDPDCRIVEANGAMARLLGCTQEELRGRHYASLVEPEDLARQPLRIAETFANGRVSMERRLVRKDGSVVDVELGSARIDERRLLTILRDVTERERTQAALRESEELFRTLLGAVFDGIVIHEG